MQALVLMLCLRPLVICVLSFEYRWFCHFDEGKPCHVGVTPGAQSFEIFVKFLEDETPTSWERHI